MELAERLERLGPTTEYREPFLGGASVGLAFLERNPQANTVWLNDIRPELIGLWRAVKDYPEEFADRLSRFPRHLPTLQEAFYDYLPDVRATRSVPKNKDDLLELAVGTQVVQQMTYNGMPNVTPVTHRRSRWNPKFYRRKAKQVSELFRGRSVKLTATDFAALITAPGDATIFLDPPYYLEGPKLYPHKMAVADHLRLARLLRECPHRWLLTYDDAPFIRRLYRWAKVEPVRVRYFGRPDRRPYRMETELLITAP
jgi:DNA adenine methylase